MQQMQSTSPYGRRKNSQKPKGQRPRMRKKIEKILIVGTPRCPKKAVSSSEQTLIKTLRNDLVAAKNEAAAVKLLIKTHQTTLDNLNANMNELSNQLKSKARSSITRADSRSTASPATLGTRSPTERQIGQIGLESLFFEA